MEAHTGEAGQLEDGEEDHGDREQRGVLCQNGTKRVCVAVLARVTMVMTVAVAVDDVELILAYHG